MRQTGSAITTSQGTPGSETGMQLGAHGSATPESSRAAAWLVQRRPADVDRAALSRASSLNAGLEIRVVDGLPVKVTVAGPADARERAAAAMAGFLTPAPERQIEEWLAELSVITRRKQDDDITEGLRLSAYTWRLAEYPADVAKEALLRHSWLFFPAWAELREVCEKLAAPRRAMLWHLQNAPQSEPEARDLPSLERRAEMVEMAKRMTAEMAERATHRILARPR